MTCLSFSGGLEHPPQLPTRGHAELRVDAMEMGGDRAVREKQLLTDLAVRQAVRGHPGDLQLLCSQLAAEVDPPRSRSLAGGAQLVGGTLGPRHSSESLEA